MKKKVYIVISLIFLCVLLSVFINSRNINTKDTFIKTNKKLPIYSVETKEKKVALTFDTSWGNDYTMQILDVLQKYNVKATFFLIGKWVDDFPDDVKAIYSRGHEIGNHSNSHPDMTALSRESILNEIDTTDIKIFQLTGQVTKLFRCPEGKYNDSLIKTVEDSGRYSIQWDVDSIDWREMDKNSEYQRVVNKTRSGSIILFHTNARYTPDNLARVIEKLQKDGYEFVVVSDLIYKYGYHLDNYGKQIQD